MPDIDLEPHQYRGRRGTKSRAYKAYGDPLGVNTYKIFDPRKAQGMKIEEVNIGRPFISGGPSLVAVLLIASMVAGVVGFVVHQIATFFIIGHL